MVDEFKARLTSAVVVGQGGRVSFDPVDVAAVVRDHDRLERENAALRAELVEALTESAKHGCQAYWDGTWDTPASSTYADQLRRLAELGEVEIIRDDGRRVVARWRK